MQEKYKRLTDSQWQVMAEFLPVQRKRKLNLRDIVDAIFWIDRIGSQWRNLPEYFPSWKAVNYYFNKWRRDGTLIKLNIGLNMLRRIQAGRDPDPSLVCVDSQSIKAAPMINCDRGIDGNKKVNGRKRQTLVDTMGLVWGTLVHAANGSDSLYGAVLMIELKDVLKRLKKVLVDQGYKEEFMQTTEAYFGIKAEVSSKPPSAKGFVPVKWRWVSERTFGWFNFFRRLSKDYERTVENSEGWILWTNCQINISKW
jgi:putative transposase